MTRSELILQLAYRHRQIQTKEAEMIVKVILDALSDTLAKGGRIEIRDFGSFKLNFKLARQGRNPKTGKNVNVPAKHVPHFKVGKELKERIAARAYDYPLFRRVVYSPNTKVPATRP